MAYPKLTSKIVSDLSRDCSWDFVFTYGFEGVRSVALDHVWSAIRFRKPIPGEVREKGFSSAQPAPGVDYDNRTVTPPQELSHHLLKNKQANAFFESLSFSHKREYIEWILNAKKEDTRKKRVETTMEKLSAGKKSFSEK